MLLNRSSKDYHVGCPLPVGSTSWTANPLICEPCLLNALMIFGNSIVDTYLFSYLTSSLAAREHLTRVVPAHLPARWNAQGLCGPHCRTVSRLFARVPTSIGSIHTSNSSCEYPPDTCLTICTRIQQVAQPLKFMESSGTLVPGSSIMSTVQESRRAGFGFAMG